MDYELAIDNSPATVPAGSAMLLVHPSTGATDRIDTDFLNTDTDRMLVISTRTTAREVKQKLEHYEVDESKATILDTLSIERGYTRRQSDQVRYIRTPEDLDGLIEETEAFLSEHEGKLRISVDSLTEMIYYADESGALAAVDELIALLEKYDAVGLFHLAQGVHEDALVDDFREKFDGVIELDESGEITATFRE